MCECNISSWDSRIGDFASLFRFIRRVPPPSCYRENYAAMNRRHHILCRPHHAERLCRSSGHWMQKAQQASISLRHSHACKRQGSAIGQKRPEVLTVLIDAATPAIETANEKEVDLMAESASQSVAHHQADEQAAAATPTGYKIRRPRTADEQRYDWIVVADDGRRIALGPDPVRFSRWCGRYLDSSIFAREAKGNTRDEVVHKLLGGF